MTMKKYFENIKKYHMRQSNVQNKTCGFSKEAQLIPLGDRQKNKKLVASIIETNFQRI